MSMVRTIESFVGICFNFSNKCTFYELDSLIEPNCEMTWEEYAEEVRTLMCDEFGFNKGNGSQRDKWELYNKLTGKIYKE